MAASELDARHTPADRRGFRAFSGYRAISGYRAFSGFTIVELITVVILLGILSVTAISRFVQPSAFAPGIVTHAFILQARAAQQIAASRADAQVTLTVDRVADEWRLRVVSDVDGVLRNELVPAENTTLTASSGSASGLIDASAPLRLRYDSQGDLSAVFIGAATGVPDSGVDLQFSGDSDRSVCVYPSGYATDNACA